MIIFTLLFVHRRIKYLLRPLNDIKESAIRYGDGDLDYIIAPSGTKEFQEVGESINEMRAKIKGMLDSKRALLLSIAHELRTPLTRQKINGEMIKEEKRRESILEDIEEMELIIDTLLESERLNSHQTLNRKSTSLIELFKPFADQSILLEDETKEVMVDKSKMQLALKNIIGNAKKYAGGVTEISVSVGERINIEIKDNGPGIDKEHLENLTEAFYRPDGARTRDEGGVGLGLFIANQVVLAHVGTLTFKNNSTGKGLTVGVSW